ncbi:Mor transcription activator family protein [Pseudomonas sp. 9Ag]|uniref:Mor transcription activator family protein n=1 Tax=Pseudomonas sp. 9Ag TaxID=2653167 RepID=UPI0012F33AD4|nr:Mor transcription activator family protein [Pseudomonas sp. 9Ag]VXD04061.1 Mor transcription activator family protein [Pseudomonas sp. 9Ag]
MEIDQVKELLPKQLLDIAEAIGLPAAQRLVDELGGTTWPVAKGVRRLGIIRHEALKEVIGERAATIMAEQWGSVPLYIPKCEAAIRRLRDLEINRQYVQGVREGVSANTLVAELARSYKLSDRRIWEILKQPSPDATGDLFH